MDRRRALLLCLLIGLAWIPRAEAQESGLFSTVAVGCADIGSSPLCVAGLSSVTGSVVTVDGSGNVGTIPNQSAYTVFGRAASTGAPSFLTLAKGHLPAAVAYEDEANVFSEHQSGSNYASQTTGWRITSAGAADFRYLFADELHARQFITDLVSVTAGLDQTVKSAAMLGATFTCPSETATSTLTVRDLPSMPDTAAFEANDFVVVRNFSRSGGALTISECVGRVTSYADQADGLQTWTFTRQSAPCGGTMTAAATVAIDSLVLDYGVSGQGYAEVNAVDGTYGANSPYYQLVTWTTCPIAANRVVRGRFGNLSGSYGYSSASNTFGLGVGVTTGAHLTVDPTNGVRGRHNTTTKFQIDASGNASFSEGAVTINNTGLSIGLSTLIAGADANAYRWAPGTAAGRVGAYAGVDTDTSERYLQLDNTTSTSGWTPTTAIGASKSDTSDSATFGVVGFTSPYAFLTIIDGGTPVNSWIWQSGKTVTDGDLEPSVTDVHDLGSASKKYGVPYFALTSGGTVPVWTDSTGALFFNASSREEKRDIVPITNKAAFARVLTLQPVTYRWKHAPDMAPQVGIIAEDVVASGLPELVSEYRGIPVLQYDRLAVYMIPLLKDLADRVAQLEKRP